MKIVSLIIILSIILSNTIPSRVFAQTPGVAPVVSQNLDTNVDLSASESGSILNADTALDFTTGKPNLASANFRPPIRVAGLAKSSYQAKEKIEAVVKNAADTDDFKVELENQAKLPVNIHVDKKFVNGDFVFSINPEVGMRPGKYKIRVINASNNSLVSEQDFTWGVLAINTNKSIYLPGENADIAIAVLDENGQMVCDALVDLEITAPWGAKTILSTTTGAITVNRDCLLHEVTQRPDYEAHFAVSDTGRYAMKLTATKPNSSYTTTDRFEVRNYVGFDIERITATRVYPLDQYPVKLKIRANEDFIGKIVESVPSDF